MRRSRRVGGLLPLPATADKEPLLLLQAPWIVALRVLQQVLRTPRVAGDLPCDDAACARVVLCRVLVSLLLVCSF